MNPRAHLKVLVTFFSFLFSISLIAVSNAAVSTTPHKEGVLSAYGKLPLHFIENKGQLVDGVKFYVKALGQTLYFTDEGIVFDFVRKGMEPGSSKKAKETKKERLAFNLSFENPQKGILLEGFERQKATINYFAGRDKSQWKTDIPTYRGILYKEVYKGIDLKIFGKGREIEFKKILV